MPAIRGEVLKVELRRSDGFSMVEVLVSLALIAVGALIAMAMVAGSGIQSEKTKEYSIAYKATQDVMETLLTMDKTTLLLQKDWDANNPGDLTFQVTALNPVNPPTGYYKIYDRTAEIDTTLTAWSIVEIVVRFQSKDINITLTCRRNL